MQIIACSSLTGGTSSAVDGIYTGGLAGKYSPIANGDSVFVPNSTGVSVYVFNSTSGLDESTPLVVKPDFSSPLIAYAGTGRWELVGLVDKATFETGFTYETASPLTIVTIGAGTTVYKVSVYITTAFNGTGAAITVGDASDADRLMTTTEVNPAAVSTYETHPTYIHTAKTAITMTITPGAGASSGVGRVVLHLQGKS